MDFENFIAGEIDADNIAAEKALIEFDSLIDDYDEALDDVSWDQDCNVFDDEDNLPF